VRFGRLRIVLLTAASLLRASNKTSLAHQAAGKNRQPQPLAQFPLQLNFLSNTASPQIMNIHKKYLRCAIKKFFYSYSLSSRGSVPFNFPISRVNQALATLHSRLTLAVDRPITSAVSSRESPAKNRRSTILLASGSRDASRVSKSSRASIVVVVPETSLRPDPMKPSSMSSRV
jgi:hypothetical protein